MKQEVMKEKWEPAPPDTTADHGGYHGQHVVGATVVAASSSTGSLVFLHDYSLLYVLSFKSFDFVHKRTVFSCYKDHLFTIIILESPKSSIRDHT